MVGIDHDEVVLKAIKDGFVNGTMLQNPYGQGYIGSYALDRLRHGCKVKADAPFKTIALDQPLHRFGHRLRRQGRRRQLCRLDAVDHQEDLRRFREDLSDAARDPAIFGAARDLRREACSEGLRGAEQ